MTDSEISESNNLFVEYIKYVVSQNTQQEIWESDGLSAAWSFTDLTFCNAILLSHPVRDIEDLEARIKKAVAYARKFDLPWILLICEDWLPEEIRPQIPEILSKYELFSPIQLTGMAADKLVPPVKTISNLECLRSDNLEMMRTVGDICAASFEAPSEYWYKFLGSRELWGNSLFASVGYVEGKAVSTAVTVAIADRLYLALVGTLSEDRGKGYASATIRHSMAEAERVCGMRPTILHSTSVGVSAYKKLGYRPVASFLACTFSSPESEAAIE